MTKTQKIAGRVKFSRKCLMIFKEVTQHSCMFTTGFILWVKMTKKRHVSRQRDFLISYNKNNKIDKFTHTIHTFINEISHLKVKKIPTEEAANSHIKYNLTVFTIILQTAQRSYLHYLG